MKKVVRFLVFVLLLAVCLSQLIGQPVFDPLNQAIRRSSNLREIVKNVNFAKSRGMQINQDLLNYKIFVLVDSFDKAMSLLTIQFPPKGGDVEIRKQILGVAIKKRLGRTKTDFSRLAGQCYCERGREYFIYRQEEDYFSNKWLSFKQQKIPLFH